MPAEYVFRAKLILILMLDAGATFAVSGSVWGSHTRRLSGWKERFLAAGIDGLDTSHPGQQPYGLTTNLRARVLNATRKKPSDGSTDWSGRKLANCLGISKDLVRIWQEARIKPQRLEGYMASNDPDFETKAADIMGIVWSSTGAL